MPTRKRRLQYNERGTQADQYPLHPMSMARVCRQLASDLRAEAAAGWPPIGLASDGRGLSISRADAAVSMDAQAARWEIEAAGGPRDTVDRAAIGKP